MSTSRSEPQQKTSFHSSISQFKGTLSHKVPKFTWLSNELAVESKSTHGTTNPASKMKRFEHAIHDLSFQVSYVFTEMTNPHL